MKQLQIKNRLITVFQIKPPVLSRVTVRLLRSGVMPLFRYSLFVLWPAKFARDVSVFRVLPLIQISNIKMSLS